MFLLAHLAKVQGLKGEFLLHEVMDEPEKLEGMGELVLAPPALDLAEAASAPANVRRVKVRTFRFHQDRACVSFEGIPDRTAAEPLKGWALWAPDEAVEREAGATFRHEWIGCQVFVAGDLVGEVLRLDPTPMGYDMVILRDLRPGRTGQRDVPYIKAWFQVDLEARRIDLDPPPGLLDLDRD